MSRRSVLIKNNAAGPPVFHDFLGLGWHEFRREAVALGVDVYRRNRADITGDMVAKLRGGKNGK